MEERKRLNSRREFLRAGAAAAAMGVPVLRSWATQAGVQVAARGRSEAVFPLNANWRFGGKLGDGELAPEFDDSGWERVTLPHCVAKLVWQKWDPVAWQDIWVYQRRFDVPAEFRGLRLFLHFDRVMAAASPVLNGHALPQHVGGFLPFEYEITKLVKESGNVLTVAVDAHWLNVPPSGSSKGPADIDYLLPGGITGHVRLCAVPQVFVSEVFARPRNVLDAERKLEVSCRINCAAARPATAEIDTVLLERDRVVAQSRKSAIIGAQGSKIRLTMNGLQAVKLWEIGDPRLYELAVTLRHERQAIHTFRTRVGFREERFDVDGFFLNGKRTRLFGLNRHELFPYTGFAMPDRVQRKDAEILRREFNCNIVRCSHYPQSEAFLDACDELGLMVWEEIPGWWYVGDEAWQKLLVRDVEAMVRRDRNHASIVIWGVRVNESLNHPDLYAQTTAVARALDDSRPASGTMTPWSRKNWEKEWKEDVFAYDDYHSAPDGGVGIDPPLPGVPYMVTETVGQCNYGGEGMTRRYRRAGSAQEQMLQAIYHAQAHDRAAAFSRCAGALAWCAFDYASIFNGYNAIKCPGVADVFRIPKLGATFYMSQTDPAARPVIEPDFYWDFGSQTPTGPGKHVAIFSNCERLEVFVGDKHHSTLVPDRTGFPNLKYPPFFADLQFDGGTTAELRIEGFLGANLVLARRFSADRASDRLSLAADDAELFADGEDATRVWFAAQDKFGALRAFADGEVRLHVTGPGVMIGESGFELGDAGGAGAVWVRTIAGQVGTIAITAEHEHLGRARVEIRTRERSQ